MVLPISFTVYFILLVGYIIEWGESKFFNASWEWFDVFWTMAAAPFGMLIHKLYPAQFYDIAIIYISIIIWEIVKLIYKKIKSGR